MRDDYDQLVIIVSSRWWLTPNRPFRRMEKRPAVRALSDSAHRGSQQCDSKTAAP